MKRKAVVAGISENWIDCLSLDEVEQAHEKEHGTHSACGTHGCGCRVSGRPFRAAKPEDLPINVGDTVQVSSSGSRALFAFIAVLGIPIAMGILGWYLAGSINPSWSQGAQAAGAGILFVLSMGLSALMGGKKIHKNYPVITSVLR